MKRPEVKNFCVIAHIDHGKSTMADRMLEITSTVPSRQMKEQVLDSMDLERERGITIKLQPVRMRWKNKVLNLIDTPGHVDFQYEVNRSLQAVEGAVLLVDATQGIQAQTMSNLYMALERDMVIIPVVNKIDLPAADVEGVKREIEEVTGFSEDIIAISAKTGEGIEKVLDAVARRVPAAKAEIQKRFRAMIFDSVYDEYKGVITYVKVVEGVIEKGKEIVFMGTGASDKAQEVGTFSPSLEPGEKLVAGEVGYIATGLKAIRQARVGDTICLLKEKKEVGPLPGFRVPQPKVFAGVYPVSGGHFYKLRRSIDKLKLNDSSITVKQHNSVALGQGFQCGFLGLLHLDIVRERLLREYDVELIMTAPNVMYQLTRADGSEIKVSTPSDFPDASQISTVKEQYVKVEVITPINFLGKVFELMKDGKTIFLRQENIGKSRVMVEYELPLRELVVDFYDRLKSATSGYGSLSYELSGWREADVVKLDILVNHDPVEALSTVVSREAAQAAGRKIVKRLKDKMPKQMFAVPLQAAVGGTVVARETLSALRKDVTGYLYGGDVTRKKKLLEKQKKGKKKMAQEGKINIPPEVYRGVLKS